MPNYKQGNQKFINPYNFVSIKGNKPIKNSFENGSNTGYLECVLTTKTPLIIPDTFSKEVYKTNDHFSYKTYMQDNQLVIPGSSLRGSIRSVYETLTNSCMVTLNEKEHITTREGLGNFKPCVLKKENNNWVLYDANKIALVINNPDYAQLRGDYYCFNLSKKNGEKCIVNGEDTFFSGDEVDIGAKSNRGPGHKKYNKRTGQSFEVWNNGSIKELKKGKNTGCYLYIGELIKRKHAESVFKITEKNSNYQSDKIRYSLEQLEDVHRMYNSSSINRNLGKEHSGYPAFERMKHNGIIPLWYTEENKHLYFSFAAIGRHSYYSTMKDLVNEHEPCKNRSHLCPACKLFGMVGDSSLGSRVRFSDAICSQETKSSIIQNVTLKELGSPRPSYRLFYSECGKAYDESGASIRGRKYYWHHDTKESTTNDKNNRNATFDLVKEGTQYKFKVYYNNLTEDELRTLSFALSLENNLMHKVGHAKPLGFGSVKIEIKNNIQRIFSENTYKVTVQPYSNSSSLDLIKEGLIDQVAYNELKTILNYQQDSIKICYPYISNPNNYTDIKPNDIANHKWFNENSRKKGGEGILPYVINAKEKPLQDYQLFQEQNTQNRNNQRQWYNKGR